VIEAARKARIRLQISHLKTSGPKNWSKIDDAIALIEDARSRGVEVYCDRYPYTASFTGLSAVMSEWVFEGSRKAYRDRLRKADVRSRLREEIIAKNGDDYLDRVVIAQTFSENARHLEGLSVTEAARRDGKNALEFLFDLLAGAESEPTAIYHTMSEENMIRILKLPYSSVGSDSAVRAPDGPLGTGKPHPRAYGSFPRMLRLVREKKFMSLEEAVRKMTSAPAEVARIAERGRIETDRFADIVVFDPDKVCDTATYDDPHQFPEGIECVIVNGSIAARAGEITGERAGRIIRLNALV